MTAVLATFVDFKTVRTRSIVQLVFEVPIEGADAALLFPCRPIFTSSSNILMAWLGSVIENCSVWEAMDDVSTMP